MSVSVVAVIPAPPDDVGWQFVVAGVAIESTIVSCVLCALTVNVTGVRV
jgi:hypothetical protein